MSMRAWKWRRRVICWCVTIIVFALVMSSPILRNIYHCSNDKSRQAIQVLCEEYKREKVNGKLCPDLCHYKTIDFVTCVNYDEGKQVFEVLWKGERYVLKSQKAYMSQYHPTWHEDATGLRHTMSLPIFYGLVQTSVSMNLCVNDSRNHGLATHIYQDWFPEGSGGSQLQSAMDSVWALVQQDEYLLNVYFKHLDPSRSHLDPAHSHFDPAQSHLDLAHSYRDQDSAHHELPELYGTCGHMYMVEDALTPWFMSPGVSTWWWVKVLDWRVRARVSMQLIEVVEALQHDYPQVLHMCDVKPDNFGVAGGRRRVVVTDLDSLLLHGRLMEELGGEACRRDGDCDFFDCKGRCDAGRGRCRRERANNNYQVLCHDVLLSSSNNLFTGLLSSPPRKVRARLTSLLHACAYPCPAPDKTRCPAPPHTISNIKLFLNSVLNGDDIDLFKNISDMERDTYF